MADINVTLTLDDSQYTGKLNAAGQAATTFGKNASEAAAKGESGFSRFGEMASRLKEKMEGLQNVLLGAGFLEFTHRTLEMADTISDLSAATDVSIDKILMFREAFEGAGGSADKLNKVITKLAQNINDAREGSAVAQESLLKLGLSFSDMANMNTEQAMTAVIEKLANMPDKVEAAALAFRVFGKEAKMINWADVASGVANGSEEYKKYAAAIEEAGKAHDKLAAASEKLMIAFANLLNNTGILDWINNMSGDMEKFETKVRIAGEAFAIYFGAKTVIMLVEFAQAMYAIEKAILAVFAAEKLLESGTLLGRLATFAVTLAGMAATFWGIDKAVDSIVSKSEKLPATEPGSNPQTTAGTKPPVMPAWQKEIVQIDQTSEAYRRANEELLRNINLTTRRIGVGADQVQLDSELTKLTVEYDKQIQQLNDRIAQESATPDSAARNARIGQLKREKEQVGELYDQYVVSIGKGIKAQQQASELQRAITRSNELDLSVTAAKQVVIDSIIKQSMTTNEQKLYDIRAQGLALAQQQIAAEEKLLGVDKEGNQVRLDQAKQLAILAEVTGRFEELAQATKVSIEQSREWGKGWRTAMDQYIEDATNAANASKSIFLKATSAMEDAFVNLAKTGKFSFKDMAASIVEEILRIQIRATAANIMGAGGGGMGSLFGGIKSLFGFASGGVVSGNDPVIVGERGPEIFMPSGNGTIIPNNKIGGGGSVTLNINAVDAPSFQALVARNPQFIHAVAEMGRRSIPGAA